MRRSAVSSCTLILSSILCLGVTSPAKAVPLPDGPLARMSALAKLRDRAGAALGSAVTRWKHPAPRITPQGGFDHHGESDGVEARASAGWARFDAAKRVLGGVVYAHPNSAAGRLSAGLAAIAVMPASGTRSIRPPFGLEEVAGRMSSSADYNRVLDAYLERPGAAAAEAKGVEFLRLRPFTPGARPPAPTRGTYEVALHQAVGSVADGKQTHVVWLAPDRLRVSSVLADFERASYELRFAVFEGNHGRWGMHDPIVTSPDGQRR